MKIWTRILSVSVILAILSLSLGGCLERRSDGLGFAEDAPNASDETITSPDFSDADDFPPYAYSTTFPTYTYATQPPTTANTISVPDLTGTDDESAKTLLVNCGLVPVMAEEFSDYITQGLVTRSEPAAFTEVPRGTRVIVYVSRGQSSMRASNFQYTWQNKVSNSPASVKVEQVFVEGDMLYLDFNYRMEYYTSQYQSPIDFSRWYLRFDSFSVNIDGNIISASASGDAATGFVEHANENVVLGMRVQIPLNQTISHRPTRIEVFCKIHTKQIWANGIGRSGESSGYTYDYNFSAHNITW